MTLKIRWVDNKREAQCPANPAFPDGIDITLPNPTGVKTCKAQLPYPAKRCGMYEIRCSKCGFSMMVTAAGRRDDPRSIEVPCKPLKVENIDDLRRRRGLH